VRVAITGVGNVGRRHLETLSAIDGVEVVALADPRFGASDRHRRSALPAFLSHEEMLDEVEIDAVVLASPSGLHVQHGVEAADRGIHVIAEKPLAITLESADALIDACLRSDVRLAVISQYRFSPSVISLKQVMDSGALGDLVFLNVSLHWSRDEEYYRENGGWRGTWELDGGGALMNQGSHAVDLARWLGGPIASVMARTARIAHDIEAEDTVCAALEFRNGGLGMIEVTTCSGENHPATIRVQGTTASAIVSGDTLVVGTGQPPYEQPPGLVVRPASAHRAQFTEIFSAMAAGQAPPVIASDARETLATIVAIYESARRGLAVTASYLLAIGILAAWL
jgi:UDP-N-acetyl-2-amino-2-deoxyglucuronate dehydrogenase